jgi:type VI secretion system protein VasD
MLRTVLSVLAVATLLAGCGLTQAVSDTSSATAKAIFSRPLTRLQLDISGRAATNIASAEMHGLSVATQVRVYQLRDGRRLAKASYSQLLEDDEAVLGTDLLSSHTLVVLPEGGATLDVPLENEAGTVAVVALFREPDVNTTWRLALTRADLLVDRARVIELAENRLTLRALSKQ